MKAAAIDVTRFGKVTKVVVGDFDLTDLVRRFEVHHEVDSLPILRLDLIVNTAITVVVDPPKDDA